MKLRIVERKRESEKRERVRKRNSNVLMRVEEKK